MAVHPVAEAFPHNTTVSADTIRQKLGDAFPLVLTSAAEIQSIDFSQSNAVAIPQEVRLNGVSFVYDSTDSTTAHDGVACLVSSDGKRYKTSFQPSYFTNVISRTNTPPGSPSAGDRYIVGAAPSGAWASNADDLTVYDGQDWIFVSPVIGQTVYVRDVTGQMHWGEAGAWVEGAGSYSLAAESITERELAFPWGMVVEEETATPPGGMPAAGTKYIVGTSATGAWASQDTDIASADGAGGWVFYTPYDGAIVQDRSEKVPKRFDGDTGVWISEGGVWVGVSRVFTTGSSSLSSTGGSAYAYSVSSPPSTSNYRTVDSVTLDHTAKRSGARLRLTYRADFNAFGNGGLSDGARVSANTIASIAVFYDSVANAVDWQAFPLSVIDSSGNISSMLAGSAMSFIFEFDAPDALVHTYRVAFMYSFYNIGSADPGRVVTSIARRLLTIEEGV